MTARGIELRDHAVVGVSINAEGHVAVRAESGAAGSRQADVAALAASLGEGVLGLAVVNPEMPEAIEIARSLGPTALVASGTASAVAEAWVGAASGEGDVVYFGVAEHASAGVLRGGAPLGGTRGTPVAWLSLNPVEREDYRKVGCLEAEVAASGIVRRLVWRIKAGDESSVQSAVGDLSAVTCDHVLAAAGAGDGVAISVMRDTAKYLGMAAANLTIVSSPKMLVLGGVIASARDLLYDPVLTEIRRRLPASRCGVVSASARVDGVASRAAVSIGICRAGS
jgi:glucokinase